MLMFPVDSCLEWDRSLHGDSRVVTPGSGVVGWARRRAHRAVLDTSEGSSQDEDEEDDFFKALMTPGLTATEGTNSTRLSNKMRKDLESWCSEKQRNKLLEQAMFPALSHAAWVDVFVKVQHCHTQLCNC
ncbi:hypothetical protein GWK47_021322 [Chionoecetes opilio]|uniref:Uncharacterized protein n=1 Tax=Chionoecetes opilio TaxID=41210 RepID=A0A8J4XP81_CHIOP|nr:hypothetical protein GWK47_021322 [Chionoecetes opilio]